jgi:hypothetical protein
MPRVRHAQSPPDERAVGPREPGHLHHRRDRHGPEARQDVTGERLRSRPLWMLARPCGSRVRRGRASLSPLARRLAAMGRIVAGVPAALQRCVRLGQGLRRVERQTARAVPALLADERRPADHAGPFERHFVTRIRGPGAVSHRIPTGPRARLRERGW